ncbi:class I SAM-dependent methyltransferase [Chloroflexi bacterium TSY]|nr:class I SAM-dependent methyltransferase [Chloroflexi bacterium TSY]
MVQERLAAALWNIYRRPERPVAWTQGGNLPWNDSAFAERMLREHLDQSHGAASRTDGERALQVDWLWNHLHLAPDMQICDITCGPELYAVDFAQRGCKVTGIDFSPASIRYAQSLAETQGVSSHCRFIKQDVRTVDLPRTTFDAGLLLYGQLSVFPKGEAEILLEKIVQSLKPGGAFCIELLNQERIDKKESN